MSLEQVTTILQDMMLTTLIVSAPSLLTGLGVGLLIAIFQAATQINEQTLTFVPKIVAVFAVFGALFPWMMRTMIEFNGRIMDVIASQGGP
ncbi:MAG TPA: flagellar biosynthetic protein FliQ [Planctomycetaceae bacterium]|nr:flagellar biosynthetic protein FliQ [Planctomycetaceae bacterium]